MLQLANTSSPLLDGCDRWYVDTLRPQQAPISQVLLCTLLLLSRPFFFFFCRVSHAAACVCRAKCLDPAGTSAGADLQPVGISKHGVKIDLVFNQHDVSGEGSFLLSGHSNPRAAERCVFCRPRRSLLPSPFSLLLFPPCEQRPRMYCYTYLVLCIRHGLPKGGRVRVGGHGQPLLPKTNDLHSRIAR